MPRPKKAGGPEPKRRSRNGCWPCKTRKIKCGEEKPKCHHCERQGETCDYSIRLNWEGRTKRKSTDFMPQPAKTPTSATGGQRPGMVPRPISEPNFGGPLVLGTAAGNVKSQMSPGMSVSSAEFPPIQKTESIRDVYSLEATSKGHIIPLSPYDASFGLRVNPKIITDLRPHNEGRLGLGGEDESARTTIADMSFIGMHGGQQLTRDHISASQLSRIRDPSSASYPSPTDSSLDSPPLSALQSLNFSKDQRFSPSSGQMPPPSQSNRPSPLFFGDNTRSQEIPLVAGQHTPKRLRTSPSREFSDPSQRYRSPSYGSYHGGPAPLHTMPSSPSQNMSSFHPYSPSDAYGPGPFTSAVSSMRSGSNQFSYPRKVSAPGRDISPDRRLSVSSLLADPLGGNEVGIGPGNYQQPPFQTLMVDYGLDRGISDWDLPNNNDLLALDPNTPINATADLNHLKSEHAADELNHSGFGFGLNAPNSAHGEGGYYAKAVPVLIPRALGNLPATLQNNPMNLLYFHHFLNHTARILVPHDCSENPFKSILPQMAVGDSNLLHLLLAYSASHRARLLNHREPTNRIAHWVRDVFPSLRRALDDPTGQVSNVNLATAIMLASLQIISPNTFEVEVSWQNHLRTARSMLLARGRASPVHRKDRVSYFLSRWFAYLDVLGSLSGGKNDQPVYIGEYWVDDDADEGGYYFQIDCLLGFTSRCIGLLAQVADLARICDSERINSEGVILDNWQPPASRIAVAEQLKSDLQESRTRRYPGCCPHHHDGVEDEEGWDSVEMEATNDAFHWAGLVHLNRRVLGKNSEDFEVQTAVKEIVDALDRVRKGSTAEACLLFPMFTAGCDALQRDQRNKIMGRLRVVENTGMTHVKKARKLMEKVWETGRPWETLVSGEFFG